MMAGIFHNVQFVFETVKKRIWIMLLVILIHPGSRMNCAFSVILVVPGLFTNLINVGNTRYVTAPAGWYQSSHCCFIYIPNLKQLETNTGARHPLYSVPLGPYSIP